MKGLRLLTVPIDEFFYLKVRDILIDKADIEGYDSLVKKGIERVALWHEVEDTYAKRNSRLLSIIHSKEEIEDIVKSNLDYFLKGYKFNEKKAPIAGESFDVEDFLYDLLGVGIGALIGGPLGAATGVAASELARDMVDEWGKIGGEDYYNTYDDFDESDYEYWYDPMPYGASDQDPSRPKPKANPKSTQTPAAQPDAPADIEPIKPMSSKSNPSYEVNFAIDRESGNIVATSVNNNNVRGRVVLDVHDSIIASPFALSAVKPLAFTAAKDQSEEKTAAIHEMLTDYLLMKFEAEGRWSLADDTLRRIKSDKQFQINAGYELLCKTLDHLNSKKSLIEKQLIVLNNNMAYYQQKLKEVQ